MPIALDGSVRKCSYLAKKWKVLIYFDYGWFQKLQRLKKIQVCKVIYFLEYSCAINIRDLTLKIQSYTVMSPKATT